MCAQPDTVLLIKWEIHLATAAFRVPECSVKMDKK